MLEKYNLFGIIDMNLSKNGNLYNRKKGLWILKH